MGTKLVVWMVVCMENWKVFEMVVHLVASWELLSGTKLVVLLVVAMENWLVVHSDILRDDA